MYQKSVLKIRPIVSLLRQPLWPFWQWPRLWQGLVLLLPVLVALGVCTGLWWQAREGVAAAQSALDALHTELALQRQNQSTLPASTASTSAPTADTLSLMSARLSAEAEHLGLTLSSVRITPPAAPAPQQNAQLRKAMLAVQLRGPYLAIKSWMSDALQTHPWLALEQLQLRPADVGSGMLDANVTWAVYVQD